jgi:hypothetical protein
MNKLDKEILIVAINFQVVEFNEHYCLLQYDYDKERVLKIYSFENDYTTIKKYYEQHR